MEDADLIVVYVNLIWRMRNLNTLNRRMILHYDIKKYINLSVLPTIDDRSDTWAFNPKTEYGERERGRERENKMADESTTEFIYKVNRSWVRNGLHFRMYWKHKH